MNAGQLLLVVTDLIALFVAGRLLLPDGTFDQTKLDTIQEDLVFAEQVEHVLVTHGLHVPEKVAKVIALLPLVATLVG